MVKEKNKSPQQLGPFFKERREAAGLSQKEVADKLGYSSAQFISNWERGHALPPTKTLKKIGQIYHISTDELFKKVLNFQIEKVTTDLKKKFYGNKKN